jgi:hypothetical protein
MGYNRFFSSARLAQSAERKALNLVVVGSSPTVGVLYWFGSFFLAPTAVANGQAGVEHKASRTQSGCDTIPLCFHRTSSVRIWRLL